MKRGKRDEALSGYQHYWDRRWHLLPDNGFRSRKPRIDVESAGGLIDWLAEHCGVDPDTIEGLTKPELWRLAKKHFVVTPDDRLREAMYGVDYGPAH